MLLVLGVCVLLDALRRSVVGSAPEGTVMIGVASLSLAVNATVLYLLTKYRTQGVHLRAVWIFTRADVIANLGVMLSSLIIQLTGFRVSDLIVGAAIGLYVIKEAFEILRKAREAGEQAARL